LLEELVADQQAVARQLEKDSYIIIAQMFGHSEFPVAWGEGNTLMVGLSLTRLKLCEVKWGVRETPQSDHLALSPRLETFFEQDIQRDARNARHTEAPGKACGRARRTRQDHSQLQSIGLLLTRT
jgi:hypothetical protein